MAKQAKLHDETVNQTNELQEDSTKVRERTEGRSGGGAARERGGQEERHGEGEEKKKRNVFEDPALGKNIDISG